MRILGVVALVALSGACVSGGADVSDPVPTLFEDPVPEIDTEPSEPASSTSSSSTVPISERLPLLAQEFPGAVVTADGVLLPITGTDGDVWFVLGPCGEERIEPSGSAMLATAQHVVLDPGGNDDGAARTNLAVAQRTAELLEAEGVVVALTRLGPAELAAETRGAVGPALGAVAFVSIHRGEIDAGRTDQALPAVFHRADDGASRRLAGLIHEEVAAAFADAGVELGTHAEPGVRPLLNQRGDDYFRVLQTSAGTAGARVEMLGAAQNDTTLLSAEEGRDIEAQALADALVRFLVSEEEGSGFIDSAEAVRTAPTTDSPGGCG